MAIEISSAALTRQIQVNSQASKVVNITTSDRQENAAQGVTQAKASEQKEAQKTEPETSLLETVKSLNEQASSARRSLLFEVDTNTGITVITVKNTQTQEVIRQIPSEEALKLAKHLDDFAQHAIDGKGLLISTEA